MPNPKPAPAPSRFLHNKEQQQRPLSRRQKDGKRSTKQPQTTSVRILANRDGCTEDTTIRINGTEKATTMASGYGEPDWVNASGNNNQESTVVDANTPSNVEVPPEAHNSSEGGSVALWGLSALNVGLSAMMCTLGVLTIISVHENGVGDLAEPFLASYMILFALLLFFYELMWWRPMPKINKGLRRNFGFMYGLKGKGLYLIFVACLCLGLGKEASVKALNYATGAAFLGAGILHFFIVCSKPELAAKYVAPTLGLTAEDEPGTPNVV